MTIREICNCDKQFLTPQDVAEVLGVSPYSITLQARKDKEEGTDSFGFKVMVIGTRTKIHRNSFLRYMMEEELGL